MDELINMIGGEGVFLTKDATRRYKKFKMADNVKNKTALLSSPQLHQFRKSLLGPRNALLPFQHAEDVIISDNKRHVFFVNHDIILIFCKTAEQYKEHLCKVVSLLNVACRTLKV